MISRTANKKGLYIGSAIAAATAAAVLHTLPLGSTSSLLIELRNSLHSPAFAALTAFLFLTLSRAYPKKIAAAIAGSICILTGALGELLQLWTAGSASISDLASDAIGILVGLCIGVALGRESRVYWIVAAIIGVAYVSYPVYTVSKLLAERHLALPSILSFEHDWERKIFSPVRGARIVIRTTPRGWGKYSGKAAYVAFSTQEYSGVEIDPAPDWSEYSHFSFEIASNDSRHIEISIRIDDESHSSSFRDRFGRSILVGPEKTTVEIPIDDIRAAPANRTMDMTSIRSVQFFMTRPTGDEVILIDEIRLENKHNRKPKLR